MNRARLEGKKTQYDLGPSNFVPPEVEIANRSFAEGARYYAQFDHQKVNGIKVVPKPAAHVNELLKEATLADW